MTKVDLMNKTNRRYFIKVGLISALLVPITFITNAISAVRLSTPRESAGPFYPITAQQDKDFDLTHVAGSSELARGQVIIVEGSVADTEGKAIADVAVEIWQANDAGRYAHLRDTNPAALDLNFQGWAIVRSGKQGGFRFKTIMPGAYSVSASWQRPPHIHYKVTKPGYVALTTQMYFLNHPLNKIDALITRKSSAAQRLMMAIQSTPKNNINVYQYQIVLAKT
jgi:protocatechuate 3,4-dioxygenase beta subunit